MKLTTVCGVVLLFSLCTQSLAADELIIRGLKAIFGRGESAEADVAAPADEAVQADEPAVVRGKRAWGPEQVLGKPDTPGAGDIQTAWASRTQDGQEEWLEVEFAEAVEPASVVIHETYNPGAAFKITAYSDSGMGAELWSGKDPTEIGAARGVSEIKFDTGFKTKRLRVHFKSAEVPGWNEIDAIGMKDADGKTQWAIRVKASSSYASDRQPDEGPLPGEAAVRGGGRFMLGGIAPRIIIGEGEEEEVKVFVVPIGREAPAEPAVKGRLELERELDAVQKQLEDLEAARRAIKRKLDDLDKEQAPPG